MEGPRHKRSVAGGSRRVTGKGSVAGKSAVPRQLMLELVEAVQWRQGGLLQDSWFWDEMLTWKHPKSTYFLKHVHVNGTVTQHIPAF